MARFYVLAEATRRLSTSDNFPWPYEVALAFEKVARPVALGEGVGWGSVGGFFTPAEALSSQWQEHFVNANAGWLRPYIEQLSRGEPLNEAEVIGQFVRLYGKQPRSYEHPRT